MDAVLIQSVQLQFRHMRSGSDLFSGKYCSPALQDGNAARKHCSPQLQDHNSARKHGSLQL